MAVVHGLGGDTGGLEQGLVNGVVVEDFGQGVERLLELPADDVEHAL